jgi:hypothetical protein
MHGNVNKNNSPKLKNSPNWMVALLKLHENSFRRPTPPSTRLGQSTRHTAMVARRRRALTAAIPPSPRPSVRPTNCRPSRSRRRQLARPPPRGTSPRSRGSPVAAAPAPLSINAMSAARRDQGHPNHAPAAAPMDYRPRLRSLGAQHLHAPEVPPVHQAALPHGGAHYLGLPPGDLGLALRQLSAAILRLQQTARPLSWHRMPPCTGSATPATTPKRCCHARNQVRLVRCCYRASSAGRFHREQFFRLVPFPVIQQHYSKGYLERTIIMMNMRGKVQRKEMKNKTQCSSLFLLKELKPAKLKCQFALSNASPNSYTCATQSAHKYMTVPFSACSLHHTCQ